MLQILRFSTRLYLSTYLSLPFLSACFFECVECHIKKLWSVMMFCSIKNSLPFKLVSFFIFFCTLILNPKKKLNWRKGMEISRTSELAQRKRVGPITQRSVDRNNYSLSIFFTHLYYYLFFLPFPRIKSSNATRLVAAEFPVVNNFCGGT